MINWNSGERKRIHSRSSRPSAPSFRSSAALRLSAGPGSLDSICRKSRATNAFPVRRAGAGVGVALAYAHQMRAVRLLCEHEESHFAGCFRTEARFIDCHGGTETGEAASGDIERSLPQWRTRDGVLRTGFGRELAHSRSGKIGEPDTAVRANQLGVQPSRDHSRRIV